VALIIKQHGKIGLLDGEKLAGQNVPFSEYTLPET
jgi:hypothetical protein